MAWMQSAIENHSIHIADMVPAFYQGSDGWKNEGLHLLHDSDDANAILSR